MSMQEIGPTDLGRRGLDAADTSLRRISAANPVAKDASRTPGSEGDRIEVSLAARALAAGEDPGIVARNEERVAEMRKAIEAGELDSPERIERAVQRLLGG
jgi:anti-sigma28 factor (negative regulator of flagellin synthesis)